MAVPLSLLGNHDIGSTSAVRNYCKLLDLGGYNDWRVPTIEELISILYYGSDNFAVDGRYFNNFAKINYGYWSSTRSGGVYYLAFMVSGEVSYKPKDYVANIRCVRDF